MAARTSVARTLFLIFLASLYHCAAAGQVYYFTGAVWVDGPHNSGTYAAPAVCPAGNPVSCDSISQGGYCCPANNYCTWSDSKVACCPNDCTCSGWEGTYEPTSWYPSTTHWQATSTYVAPAAYTPVQSTPAAAGGYQQYCSTLYAHGPGLPTTAQGQCGIILVEEPQANMAEKGGMGYLKLGIIVGMLHLVGGILFAWR